MLVRFRLWCASYPALYYECSASMPMPIASDQLPLEEMRVQVIQRRIHGEAGTEGCLPMSVVVHSRG